LIVVGIHGSLILGSAGMRILLRIKSCGTGPSVQWESARGSEVTADTAGDVALAQQMGVHDPVSGQPHIEWRPFRPGEALR
jgi:hypothetical protein